MKKQSIMKILSMISSIIFTLIIFGGCGRVQNAASNEEILANIKYPLTVTDFYGRKVTIDKKPERVISASPNVTEIMYALNASDRLKGRTDYCDYPLDVKDVPSIGSMTDPSVEKVIELKPDVVIASNMINKTIVDKLEKLNIKVVVLHGTEDIDGAYDAIEKVDMILGDKDAANKIVSDMKKKVEMVKSKVKDVKKPKVYYVVSYGQYGDYTGGKDTYIDKMIQSAGGANIAEDVSGWKYSLEKVMENDPDIIICSKYFNTKEGLMKENGYKDLRAVKNGNVFEIDNNLLDRQGPRMADGLLELARVIHPELFKN
jgi:iron complex transport system substrate-binding protein